MLRLRGHGSRNPILHLTFFPDASRLASAAWYTTALRVWDLAGGTFEEWGSAHNWRKPAFSPDGSLVASAAGNLVFFWDASGAEVGNMQAPSRVWGLCFLPDGRLALAGDNHLFHCRPPEGGLKRGQALARLEASVLPTFAPAAGLFARLHQRRHDPYEQGLSVCNLGTGEVAELTPVVGYPSEITLSTDGRFLALASGSRLVVWDVPSRAVVLDRRPDNSFYFIKAVAFSPDGRYLATGGNDQTVRLWDTRTWETCAAYNWVVGRVTALAFSPDGMRAAAGSYTGKVVVWDVDE